MRLLLLLILLIPLYYLLPYLLFLAFAIIIKLFPLIIVGFILGLIIGIGGRKK